jgi:hypothetical protein
MWDDCVDLTEEAWIKVAEECEDEVISLSSGFFFAVFVRAAVTDSLPYMLLHGWEHRKSLEIAKPYDVIQLWAIGLACALLCILMNVCFYGALERGINESQLRTNYMTRFLRLSSLTLGMVFAWCTIFGAHLLSLHLDFLYEGLKLRLYLALFQTAASFLVILVLDFFADNAGPAYAKAIVMIIHCLGAAVGLSWEHTFDKCVEVCVEFMTEDSFLFGFTDDPKIWALCLSAAIVFTVLPAYRFYIVPRMYHLMEEYEDHSHAQEAKYEQEQYIRRSLRGDPDIQAYDVTYLFAFGRDSTALEMAGDDGKEHPQPR